MTPDIDIDPELLAGFLYESLDSLTEAENALVNLEKDPENPDIVNTIFRAAHSLKGNSAFFGLMRVKVLSHKMEDVLDAIRQQRLQVGKSVIEALLPGLDLLRRMLENTQAGAPELSDENEFNRLLEILEEALMFPGGQPVEKLVSSLRGLLPGLPPAARAELEQLLQRYGSETEPDGGDSNSRADNPVTVLASLLTVDELDEAERRQQLEEQFRLLEALSLTETSQRQLDQALDIFHTFADSPVGLDETARELIGNALKGLNLEASPSSVKADATIRPPAKSAPDKDSSPRRSLRIDENSLDGFFGTCRRTGPH